MRIYAPVKNTNGIYASVRFVNGVGETDNPNLIEWFRSHGYKVSGSFTTVEPTKVEEPQLHQTVENDVIEKNNEEIESKPDFESMTPNELRQWAIENGYGAKIRNLRNKEKLLDILRGE